MTEETQDAAVGRWTPGSIASAVLLPALLVPLAAMPWDMGTSVLWLIGFACAVVSLWRLARTLLARAVRKAPVREPPRLLRQGLTVLVFAGAAAAVGASQAAADAYAQQLGEQIQLRCRDEGACPRQLDGWRESGGRLRSQHGLTAKFDLFYSTDGTAFTIAVVHNIDEHVAITGGVAAPLTVTHVQRDQPEQ